MTKKSTFIVSGLDSHATQEKKDQTIRNVFLESTNNVSWLTKGQTVLLKPALNSPDPYPATTDPDAVRVVAQELTKRGARVVIGDQSGIGHVLHTPSGVMRGSTRVCYHASGMSKGMDAYPFVAFEENGWNTGFVKFTSKNCSAWTHGYYISRCVGEADHIVNLPRISTHGQAGVTIGFKNYVGILRDDSRLEFHDTGPFASMMSVKNRKSGTPVQRDVFIRKITQIFESVKDKVRLTLVSSVCAQVTGGPDKTSAGLWNSYVSKPDAGLIYASSDPVAVEAFGIADLYTLQSRIPHYQKICQIALGIINPLSSLLDEGRVRNNLFVKYGLEAHYGICANRITVLHNNQKYNERIDEIRSLLRLPV